MDNRSNADCYISFFSLSVFFPLPPTLFMIHHQFLWTGCKEWGKFLFAYFMPKEHPEEMHLLTFSLEMQILLRADKILKSEILFCDFPPASSFLTGCSARCSSTSSHIISRKSADPVQQIETLHFLVTFWPSEVICGLPGIWSYGENYGFKRSERERLHLPEKYSSSKHPSDHIVFGDEKKNPYLACRVWEKILFCP